MYSNKTSIYNNHAIGTDRDGFEMNGFGSVNKMGSSQSNMEQIPGAEAPNLERILTGGPGVGGEDGEGLA